MTDSEYNMVIESFLGAIEAGDEAAIRQVYRDDIEIWHNFTNKVISKDENIEMLMDLGRNGIKIRYTFDEQIVVGNRGVRRHQVEATVAGGERVVLRVVMFATVENGQITRLDEYVDSKELDALNAAIAAVHKA